MKKTIIQVAASIVLAIVAAGFFYDSGVLLFRYGDKKQAVLHLAPAVSFALLYVRCAYQIGRKQDDRGEDFGKFWSLKQSKAAANMVFSGVFGTGISLYLCRFADKFSLLGLCFVCAAVTCALTAVCVFRMRMGGNMTEMEYRKMLLSLTKKLETKGCLNYSKMAKSFTQDMIKGKARTFSWMFCAGNLWIMAMAVVCVRIGIGSFLLPVFCAGVLLLLGIRGLSFAGVSKELMLALNGRKSQDILTALILYYEVSDGKFQSMAHIIQSYAVAALCDQEAYEEALALIGTIRRPPKWETYYKQWELICLEGMRDQQGMRKLLESRSVCERKKRGGRNDGWDLFETAKAMADKDYEKVLELTRQNPGTNERTAKSREKFAKDAEDKIFGEK